MPQTMLLQHLPFNNPFGQVIHEYILGYCHATADCARLGKYDKGDYGLFPNIGFRSSACRGGCMGCLLNLMRISQGRVCCFLCLFLVGWVGLMRGAGLDIIYYAGEYGSVYLAGCVCS